MSPVCIGLPGAVYSSVAGVTDTETPSTPGDWWAITVRQWKCYAHSVCIIQTTGKQPGASCGRRSVVVCVGCRVKFNLAMKQADTPWSACALRVRVVLVRVLDDP